MPEERLSRREAAKLLCNTIRSSVKSFGQAHPNWIVDQQWNMPVSMPVGRWQQLLKAFEGLAGED